MKNKCIWHSVIKEYVSHSTEPTTCHSYFLLSMHMLQLYSEDSFIYFNFSLKQTISSKLVACINISKT